MYGSSFHCNEISNLIQIYSFETKILRLHSTQHELSPRRFLITRTTHRTRPGAHMDMSNKFITHARPASVQSQQMKAT